MRVENSTKTGVRSLLPFLACPTESRRAQRALSATGYVKFSSRFSKIDWGEPVSAMSIALGLLLPLVAAEVALAAPSQHARSNPAAHGSRVRLSGDGGTWGPPVAHGAGAACN